MARGNGNGPNEQGPKTGRGLGDCEPKTETERTSVYTRRGGQGGGWRKGDGSGGGRSLNRRGAGR